MEPTNGKHETKGKATPGNNRKVKRKPYFDNPDVEAKAAKVHAAGFNIYMIVSKLKKDLGRTAAFPDEVILLFIEHYWKYKPKETYPYFLKAFQMVSGQWHADNQVKRNEEYKKQGMPQSIKDILKGMAK